MIKAVLFDLDGTLIDTNEAILKSFKYAFEKILNLKVADDEVTKMFGTPLKDSFGKYTDGKLYEVISCYRTYNESIHDDMCTLFNGVRTLLEELKNQGIKLAIVTSKRRVLAERGMEICGILDMFDAILTPESTTHHKPHKEPVQKACEMLGVKTSEAIMVGDSAYDLLSGKSAGAKTCGVRYTVVPIEVLEKVEPDYFIDEILEILEIIKKENSEVA